ncbi:MAG: S1 RNA-binding domain-containing protein, partial [Fimbriimonadaceae bacterium]|nr:S1 RNA-binding domain-containing protein [Fimbriimonadaceae bacterium]
SFEPLPLSVKGGLVVDVGVRGFMPASQVDSDWIEDLGAFVGKTVAATVIELDVARKRVVLSRREVVDRRRRDRALELRDSLAAGDECEAAVIKETARGLVVRVDDALEVWVPSEEVPASHRALKAGDRVRITVCDFTEESARGSLRLASDLSDDTADPELLKFLDRIAEQAGGPLQVVDGQLTLVIEDEAEAEAILSNAVAAALTAGAEALCVVVVGPAKRRVRAVIQNGVVRGVHPRKSRQIPGGFELVLTRAN